MQHVSRAQQVVILLRGARLSQTALATRVTRRQMEGRAQRAWQESTRRQLVRPRARTAGEGRIPQQ